MLNDPQLIEINNLKTTNWTILTLIFLTNIYFLPFTFIETKSYFRTNSFEFILPISLSINLLFITAGLTLKTKFNNSIVLLIFNVLGLLWSLFWLWLLLTTPKMD